MNQPSEPKHRPTWWAKVGVPLAVALSLLGLLISGVLLQHHVAIAVGGHPLLSGVCEVSAHSSCDAVLRSPWAYFPSHMGEQRVGGIQSRIPSLPTALWGFFFFAAVFAWYLVVGRPTPDRRWWHLLPLIATAVGTGVCAGLAYFMYTQLPEWCPLCAAAHVISALLFVVTVLLWPRGTPISRPRPHAQQLLIFILLAASLDAAGASEYFRRLHKAAAAEFKQRWQAYESDLQLVYNRYMSEPRVNIPVGPDDSIRGDVNARHTVVMFGDFQCEFCRVTERMLHQKLDDNPGRMRIVFKYFPMNSECNPYVKNRVHVAACAAASTAEAARKLGGDAMFWRMHDELFANQGKFARKPSQFVSEAAAKLGLDEKQLWTAIRSAHPRISLQEAQARAAGVDSTPAVFLDGRRVTMWALSKFWDYVFAMDAGAEKRSARASTRPATAAAAR